MGLMDILKQYGASAPSSASDDIHQHFDNVVQAAPTAVVGQGVADAFRSDATPEFGQMVGQMFGRSNPQQQAGVLNQLLQSLGPGLLSTLAGGVLGRLTAPSADGAVTAQVTPQQAAQLTPEQVQEIAAQAEKHDPTVLDKVGGFYAEHPQLVKTLGSAALAIALASMSNRMRRS